MPSERTAPFELGHALGVGEPDPDLEPRDTVRTEVPDFPPEVLATYERHVREQAAALAEARHPAPAIRDVYPRDGAPEESASTPPWARSAAAPSTMDVRQSEVHWSDGGASRDDLVTPELPSEDLVSAPPSSAPQRASGGQGASGVADHPDAWDPLPGDHEPGSVAAAIDYGPERPAARLSFAAASLGGLFALAAGAGLFLVVSMLRGPEPTPATAAPPSQVPVQETEATAQDTVEAQAAAAEAPGQETAARRVRAATGEPEPEIAARAPGTERAPTAALARAATGAAEPEPEPEVEVERDEARSDRLVVEARGALRSGDAARAVRTFREALAHDERNPRAAEGLARTHLALGELVDAEHWVGKAIALRPKRASYQRLRADILDAMGHTAAAAAARQDAADLARD